MMVATMQKSQEGSEKSGKLLLIPLPKITFSTREIVDSSPGLRGASVLLLGVPGPKTVISGSHSLISGKAIIPR